MVQIIDSYVEANADGAAHLPTEGERLGQSFNASAGGVLDSVNFYVGKNSLPTGNAYVKIYTHTGTYGSTGVPTGTALATSDALDVSTLGAGALKTFNFSGANRITLTLNTKYCAVLEYSGGGSGDIWVNYDNSSPSHAGTLLYWTGSAWGKDIGYDLIFYVNIESSNNYILSIGTGSFTLTGQAVGTKIDRKLICGTGSYSLTGMALLFRLGKRMVLNAGSFALNGMAVGLNIARKLVISTGEYILTGNPIAFDYSGDQETLPTWDYTFADFSKKTDKWAKISGGGTVTFPEIEGRGNVLRAVNPAGGEVEIHRNFTPSYGSNLYKGFESIQLDINLHGATLTGTDGSAFGFDVGGWQYISLSDYVNQGYDGWQTITIPIADLVTAGLDVDGLAVFLVIRLWHASVITVDIDNIVFKGHAYYNFTQPALPGKVGLSKWNIESVDTMKWSKDTLRGQISENLISTLIQKDKELGVSHITVDCPYDSYDSYDPEITDGYKNTWVSAIRNAGLKVWHRQHFNAWEGDYDFTKTTPRTTPSISLGESVEDVINGTDTTSWLALHYQYILNHPNDFAQGDIFSPICEIENGGVSGGETDQFSTYQEMWEFMRNLHTLCHYAFTQIGLENKIFIGFWGNSGYTALNRLDEFTVDCMGYLSIDHYVFDPVQMEADLDTLIDYYEIPLVIGEWGNTVEADQELNALNLTAIGNVFVSEGSLIVGSNYWNDIGGMYESLISSDFSGKPNYYALKSFYGSSGWGYIDDLPLPAPSAFSESIRIVSPTNTTFLGRRSRNIKNVKRVWVIGYDLLTQENYDLIYAKFSQLNPAGENFSDSSLEFSVLNNELNINDVRVFMDISERQFIAGTDYLSSVTITLTQV